MFADLEKIKKVFKEQTGYRIAKDTGISQSTISRFQTGESKFENMRLGHAITITEYADRLFSIDNLIDEKKPSSD